MRTLYNLSMAFAKITATDGNTYGVSQAGAVVIPDGLMPEFVRLGFSPNAGSGGATAWGDITGDMGNQTDLSAALDAKLNGNGMTDLAVVETVPGEPDPATLYVATGEA